LPEERGGVGAATEMIKQEILSWLGVSARSHINLVALDFMLITQKRCDIYFENLIDLLPFSPQTRKNVVDFGRALPNHTYPESAWVIYWIREVKMMCKNDV
jgi:hypothetical protein